MTNLFKVLNRVGVTHLIISGGEFTCRPHWKQELKHALAFFCVRQISNGTGGLRLFEEIQKTLPSLSCLYTLSLSLDGSRRVHDATRVPGSYDDVIEILRVQSSIQRTVITTVTTQNTHCLDQLFELLSDLGVGTWAIQLGLPAGRMKEDMFIGNQGVRALADKIADFQERAGNTMDIIPDDCFGYAHAMRNQFPWEGCPAGKSLFTILSDGTFTGCPTMSEGVGSVLCESITTLMKRYRESLQELCCDSCNNAVCHGGCRAVQQLFGKQFCF